MKSRPIGEKARELHHRLLEGDPLASEEAARLMLEPLVTETQQRFPRLDAQVVTDAAVDALLDYFENPSVGERGGSADPYGFVRTAAWRNAANLRKGAVRRRAREGLWAEDTYTAHVEDGTPLGTLIKDEERAVRDRQVAELMAGLADERDRAVLRLRLRGERDTAAFARAMDIQGLTLPEQRKLVKRAKDRIDKAIRRVRGRARE